MGECCEVEGNNQDKFRGGGGLLARRPRDQGGTR